MQFKYLLLTRFIVLNVFFTSLVLAVYGQGWLDAMITARLVELTLIIVAVFSLWSRRLRMENLAFNLGIEWVNRGTFAL